MLVGGCHVEQEGGAVEASKADPTRDLELVLGTTVEDSFEGETHRYRVVPGDGRVVELSVEGLGGPLSAAVYDAEGEPRLLSERAYGPNSEIRLVLAAEDDLPQRVELWARDGGAASYRLRVVRWGGAGPADHARVEGERLFAQAELLRRSEQREPCQRAVTLDLQALELARRANDRLLEAEILDHLGWIHRKYLQDRQRALEFYRGAHDLFAALGEGRRQSSVLNNLGRVHFDLGALESAIDCWRVALDLKRDLGDHRGEAAALSNLALASRYLGEAHQALSWYDESLAVAIRHGQRLQHSRLLNNRGRLYEALGQPAQALADLEGALEIARELGEERQQALVMTAIGRLLTHQGQTARAEVVLEQALASRLTSEDRAGSAVTLGALGRVFEQRGEIDRALVAQHRALGIFRDLGAPRSEATTLEALGRLAMADGRGEEAPALYRRALAGFRRLEDAKGEIQTLVGLAKAEHALGRTGSAVGRMEEAVAKVEEQRARTAGPSLRSSYFSTQQAHYDFYIELLMDLQRLQPDAGHDRRALEISERARARSLIDQLVGRREVIEGQVDAKLLERERSLRRRLGLVETERLRLVDRDPSGERHRILERRLDELLRQIRVLRGEIQAASPRYAALAWPRTLKTEEIQQLLDPETLLLEYRLAPRRSVLWVVETDSISSFELPGRTAIETAARRAYELLETSHLRERRVPTAEAVAHLADMILAPVLDQIAGRRLVVVTDGALQYVPFAALPVPVEGTPERASGTPRPSLVDLHEVVTLPSASSLTVLRNRLAERQVAPPRVAVIADPVFESGDSRLPEGTQDPGGQTGTRLRRLQYSALEAEAILRLAGAESSSVMTGLAATREAAISPLLGRHRWVHLATHAEVDTDHPEMTRLVFSRFDAQGRPRDGSVFSDQLYGLDLPVELVTLSACETALGKDLRGEGLVGLTQGFFYAGAARVLVSLWRVDDRATAELMQRFYRHLLEEGLPPPAALRRAQLSVRNTTGWRAPFFWAGFVLQGEWRGVEP